jgi:hypothetical protein
MKQREPHFSPFYKHHALVGIEKDIRTNKGIIHSTLWKFRQIQVQLCNKERIRIHSIYTLPIKIRKDVSCEHNLMLFLFRQ